MIGSVSLSRRNGRSFSWLLVLALVARTGCRRSLQGA